MWEMEAKIGKTNYAYCRHARVREMENEEERQEQLQTTHTQHTHTHTHTHQYTQTNKNQHKQHNICTRNTEHGTGSTQPTPTIQREIETQ